MTVISVWCSRAVSGICKILVLLYSFYFCNNFKTVHFEIFIWTCIINSLVETLQFLSKIFSVMFAILSAARVVHVTFSYINSSDKHVTN